MEIVIQESRVLTPDGLLTADVGIERGIITAVGSIAAGAAGRVVDGRGKLLLPGGVDPHVHMEQLTASGQVSSDDFASGSFAALRGGITAIGDFAYPEEEEGLAAALKRRRDAARGRSLCDCFFHVAVMGHRDDLERQMDECCDLGAISFKVHMNDPRTDDRLLERLCRKCAERGCILMVHAEDGRAIEEEQARLVRKGMTGLEFYAGSRPPRFEAAAVEAVLGVARTRGATVYIVHLTSAAGLEVVRRHREGGTAVYAETCPHYLLLTEEMYRNEEGYCCTCSPPFRRDADCEALWEGLADGSIDTVATDHCPFRRAQKGTWEGDFTRLPFGIPGVETMIPLFFSEGLKRGFSYERLSSLVTGNAAAIFRLAAPPAAVREGEPADLFLYDPGVRTTLKASTLHMNCDFSPYAGMGVEGYPIMTLHGGRVWSNG